MKLTNLFISAFVLATSALVSCSDKGYWDGFEDNEKQPSVGFNSSSFVFNFSANEIPTSVDVPLSRATAKGDLAVPMVLKDTFTVSASGRPDEYYHPENLEALKGTGDATFVNGSYEGSYRVTCDNLEAGKAYQAVIRFADRPEHPVVVDSCLVVVRIAGVVAQ